MHVQRLLPNRRIALVNGLEDMDFAIRRRQGYEKALRERGLDPDPELGASDEMTEHYGYDTARRMLAMARPPTEIPRRSWGSSFIR